MTEYTKPADHLSNLPTPRSLIATWHTIDFDNMSLEDAKEFIKKFCNRDKYDRPILMASQREIDRSEIYQKYLKEWKEL